jgi:hypothetical protein
MTTNMTIYRLGHGNVIGLNLSEMRKLRDRLTEEIDNQAQDAIDFMREYHEEG